MTLLVDHQIRKLIDEGALKVDPFDPSLINPASLDFRLGNKFGKSVPTGKVHRKRSMLNQELQDEYIWNEQIPYSLDCIDPTNKDSFETVVIEAKEYVLMPGEFIITTTLEGFDFKGTDSLGIASKVAGKSSCGRLGLANSSMAGFIDPAFACAGITLEIFNYSDTPIILIPGMKIGQLLLFTTGLPEKDYSQTGRYQNQSAGSGSKGV